ncbi:MAG: alpha/beta hydrolase fold domain-containing protein [Planctomycetota bacterium]|nr:alpha/beta hydrolase fold domain-containing protein [Planctomycetota bacterium]
MLKLLALAPLVLSGVHGQPGPAAAQSAAAEPEVVPFKETTDAKGDPVTLHLEVFKPEGWAATDRRAAVVFFFGGGWVGGSSAQFHPQSRALAARGMVAICAEYRVERRHGTPPQDCVRDAKSAMRFVRANAEVLGVDPERIAAGGGSAGGHLAAATALVRGFDEEGEDLSVSCEPALLMLFNPVIDTFSGAADRARRLGADARAMSPLHQVRAGQPPTILFHGTKDRTVPIAAARRFHREALGVGAICELHETEGAGHGYFNPRNRADIASAENAVFHEHVDRMEVFLAEHGFLPPPPLRRIYLEPLAKELRRKWPRNRTVNVVVHGHSVPAGYARTPLVKKADSYPMLLHLGLDERYPFAPTNVIVTAIGGEDSESGAARFEEEVLRHGPDVVTIDYSLNDRRIGLERAEKAWRSMIEACLERDVPVLLLTPTSDTRAELDDPKDPLRQHARQVRALATEYGVGLVDSLAAFDAHVAEGGELSELMSQVNHPSRRGHELVARALLEWFPR